ncbi:MAG: carbon-nitrogen hydrolase family protein, partial [Paracoccaceae bacterium]
MLKAALIQLNVGPDPAKNLPVTLDLIRQAANAGAGFILTPEVTNCISSNHDAQAAVLCRETDDITLSALREEAQKQGIWLLLGSVALESGDADGRYANRSFLISPAGEISARYDKIHMFDVQVSDTETYRESATYRPGNKAVVANMDGTKIGMTICYDVRFPHLYRKLAQAGAQIITVPAAFSVPTGVAHWQTLLQARAIETGCFILAPAQTGTHTNGKNPRKTWGHSLAISPWGKVLADAGTEPGITMVDLDLA